MVPLWVPEMASLEIDAKQIEETHANGKFGFVFNITGGGYTLLSNLQVIPGASRTYLDGSTPYSKTALKLLVKDHSPISNLLEDCRCVSVAVAQAMVRQAYDRAKYIFEEECKDKITGIPLSNYGGFACTAELKCTSECAYANVIVSIKISNLDTLDLVWRKGKFINVKYDVRCESDATKLIKSLASFPDIIGTKLQQEGLLSKILLFTWYQIQK